MLCFDMWNAEVTGNIKKISKKSTLLEPTQMLLWNEK